MATIHHRKEVKNYETYRVVFNRPGSKFFFLCFDDWEAACNWAEEHEEKYYQDPEWYHKWKENLFLHMRKKRLKVLNHIRRPIIVKKNKT